MMDGSTMVPDGYVFDVSTLEQLVVPVLLPSFLDGAMI